MTAAKGGGLSQACHGKKWPLEKMEAGDGVLIRVIDILDLLASGLTQAQVLEELPDLEPEDIEAALKYASSKLDHPIIAA